MFVDEVCHDTAPARRANFQAQLIIFGQAFIIKWLAAAVQRYGCVFAPMPDGDRGFVLFATVAALWVGTVIGGAESRCQSQQNAYSAREDKADSQHKITQFASQRAWLPCLVERAVANPKAGEATDKDERDLMAQEATALWAFWMLVISGIMATITALGTMLLYKQIVLTREAVQETEKATKAMNRQNEISEDAAKRQLRAYITLKGNYYYNQEVPLKPLVHISFVNRGQTPAYNVTQRSKMIQFSNGQVPTFDAFDFSERSSKTVGPGERINLGVELPDWISPPELMQIQVGNRGLCTVVEVKYLDAFDTEHTARCRIIAQGPRFVQYAMHLDSIGNDSD